MKKLYLTFLLFITTAIYAAVTSDSQYNTASREFMVEDALNDAADTPTMILCFMKALAPQLMVNKGTYLAQVDKDDCTASEQIKSGPQSEDKASATGAGDSTASKNYIDAINIVSRSSATSPMTGKTWLTIDGPTGPMIVYIKATVTSGPTDSNPYGVFQMDYTGVDSTNGTDIMKGYLGANSSGQLNWYETFPSFGFTDSLSLTQDLTAGTGTGAVRRTNGGDVYAYGYAYDTDGYCRTMLSVNGGSPTDSTEYCFDTREAQGVKTIWDYDLYDAETGVRYDLPVKGFPVQATISDTKYFGYADYHGLHFAARVVESITDGFNITKYMGGAAGQDYTVNVTRGKLEKITKTFVSLASMDKYPMNNWFDISALSIDPSEYKFYYDHANSKFVLTHNRVCTDGQGCFDTPLDPNLEFTVAQYQAEMSDRGIGAWVPGLGGIYITSNALANPTVTTPGQSVQIESEEFVDHSNYPETLYCVDNCFTKTSIDAFIAKIEADTQTSEDHPYTAATYRTDSVKAADLVVYRLGSNGITYEADGGSATYPDGLSSDEQDRIGTTQASWGARTNALLTVAGDFACADWRQPGEKDYCLDGLWTGEVTEYYVWRTGHKRWDRKYILKDGNDAINFSKPMNVYYQVPNVASNGNFAGKEIMLDYGGSGSLWGFPGACFNPTSGAFTADCGSYGSWLPWVNRIDIPFSESLGYVMTGREQTGTKYLVKGRFGAVFLTPKSSKIGSLTLGTAADLPSDTTVNVGPNGTAANYIGAQPTKPASVSIQHGTLL